MAAICGSPARQSINTRGPGRHRHRSGVTARQLDTLRRDVSGRVDGLPTPSALVTLLEVYETSVETASLQRAAPSLTPPTARRHTRLKGLSEVSQISWRDRTARLAAPSSRT